MSAPGDITARLVKYLEHRDQARLAEVNRTLTTMTERERHLVKEAAVMGYIRGKMSGDQWGTPPPDSEILFEVIDACLRMEDLYPVMYATSRGVRRRRPPKRRP